MGQANTLPTEKGRSNAGGPSKNGQKKSEKDINDNNPPALYEKRRRWHPKRVWGRFRQMKWAVLIALLGIYYIAPWIRWDRGADAANQAILVDFTEGRIYFFALEFWQQEFYYITGILILAALGLFLATALLGRVWCGFACPQTVWTDFFIWVERFIEGDRAARIRLDAAPWSTSKIAKRTLKHIIWLLIALVTGGAWIAYFVDAPTLVSDIANFTVSGNTLFFVGLFTATTYLLAGFAREQVCTYMCPWPRIQASMTDEDSLLVTYEVPRGEPRAKPSRDGNYDDRGHCIDCNNCVVVCPTGIDIRDGNQLECIGCGLCIDACDNVMDKIGLPRGLISYDSVNRMNARQHNEKPKHKIFRPRTVIYAVLMVAVAAIMGYVLSTRAHLDVNILRDRNPMFVLMKDGSIQNGYTFKILNKTREHREYVLTLDGLVGAGMKIAGDNAETDTLMLTSEPDSVRSYKLYVSAPKSVLNGRESTKVLFTLTETGARENQETAQYESVFVGPKKR
ncbi:cytochrome c oxidase accessory protein CcoG [Aestuariispira insulae]|uniref:Cytochrome c oxidase accessory protein FixG n=1 Tax=Aestuariispira insulae TaxID=1461337 RepID=A0A3D9HNN0_9PROT|nr:cytochrome c oxidase accessory protein CcoG [Aestuariispira insulae]RED51015.1 cytochrome c oxidase accessory protein FixG [Aestuariispira insulae]